MMKFDRYIPCAILRPYIHELVISEALQEQVYKVLPGAGLVIGFQFKGRLSVIENGNETALSSSGVTGLSDRYKVFKNSDNIGTVLVFFKETGAAAFFSQPLHELFQESVSLDNFMLRSRLLIFEERLCDAKSDKERIAVVEELLQSLLRPVAQDKLVIAAVTLIHKSRGSIRIAELARQLYTSQSPLEKRFRAAVGTSPKKFASIVRLKNILNEFSSVSSLTGLSYGAGFYDQAHFIKEFKAFTGVLPGDFFHKK